MLPKTSTEAGSSRFPVARRSRLVAISSGALPAQPNQASTTLAASDKGLQIVGTLPIKLCQPLSDEARLRRMSICFSLVVPVDEAVRLLGVLNGHLARMNLAPRFAVVIGCGAFEHDQDLDVRVAVQRGSLARSRVNGQDAGANSALIFADKVARRDILRQLLRVQKRIPKLRMLPADETH